MNVKFEIRVCIFFKELLNVFLVGCKFNGLVNSIRIVLDSVQNTF